MADLTLRNQKGFPLSFDEMDSNLLALDSDSPWSVAKNHITYSGSVGIGPGVTSPTYNLEIGALSNDTATIGTTDAALNIHVNGPHPFELFTNDVERFTVTTDGKIGLNEPNPQQPLDVVGNIQTTTTFIGNQAYCNSFYDGTVTISGGSIFNAINANFSGRINFGSLRDTNGEVIRSFDSSVTTSIDALPTSSAVWDFVKTEVGNADSDIQVQLDSLYAWSVSKFDSADTYFKDRLDSAYAWNTAEHQALTDRLDSAYAWNVSEHQGLTDRLDSAYAWNTAEHQALSDSITAEMIARSNADSDINVRIDNLLSDTDSALDSEHAWNVSEHQALTDRLDSAYAWNVAEHQGLTDRLDSAYAWNTAEHQALTDRLDSAYAWNTAEHQALSDSLTAEIIARKNSDSDFTARMDSAYDWNVEEHTAIRDSLNAEIVARKNSDSDFKDRMDSEHAWNVSEHQGLTDRLDSAYAWNVSEHQGLTDRLDSAYAWNTAEHQALTDRLDSAYAWNVAEHQALSDSLTAEILLSRAIDSALGARLDSDYDWNVVEHDQLQSNIDAEQLARENADSDLTDRLDSAYAWNVSEHQGLTDRLDSAYAWNVAEHQALSDSLTAEINARTAADSDIQAQLDSLDAQNTSDHSALENRLDSAYSWNQNEHNILQSQFDNLTTDSVTEGNNLYFTNARVDARNDSTIDSDFLNNRMPLTNLSDVQINTPTLTSDDVLQWNGTVWSNQSIGISGTIQFRGGVDATTEAAPAVKENGDFYVNTTRGTALGSWANVTGVDSGDGLVWDSANNSWSNLGKITQGSVIKVRPGTAISVDETDTARPVVSVDKTITDTWYYTQSQIDTKVDSLSSRIDSNYSWNVTEHAQLQANIDAEEAARISSYDSLSSRIDSNYSWNVTEHLLLQNANSDLSVAVDSNFNYFSNITNQLEININNLDSRLDSELSVIDDRFDSLALSISGDINVEIDGIQINIDSLNDRVDSEHAWNVTEHLTLSNANSDLSVAVDSNFNYFSNITNQLEININQLDSRLDSELAVIDDRFDSLALSISGDINVEIDGIQVNIDGLQTNIDSLNDRVDSEHAWNIQEHLLLQNANSDLSVSVDSNFEYFSNITNQLEININNLDSRLDSELAIVDDKLDSLSLSIGGEINVEIGNLQVNIDSLNDRVDSEHAWNLAEHLELSNADSDLRSSIDSVYTNLTININNLDSRLDSELAVIDDKLDSLSLSIGGEINVEINQIQDKLDNLTTDSVAEGTTNLYYTDARVTALVDSAYVQERVTFPEFDSNSVIELVDSDFVNSLVDFPDTQVLSTTDSLPEGTTNLYYTDSRVENKILSTVDSEYVMNRVSIQTAVRFKGSTSVDVYNAPIDPENGDIYINDSQCVANNTWIGIAGETIAEAQSLGWAESDGRWYALGGIADYEEHDSAYVQARQQYVTLDSSAPSSPYSGELWLDRNEDNVKIYDGSVWFELPSSGAGGTIDSAELVEIIDSDYVQNRQQYVTLDSSAPANPYSGELWLDRNADIVKVYDGSIWFEFPAAADGGLSEAEVLAAVDSALINGTISLDASPSGGASDDF